MCTAGITVVLSRVALEPACDRDLLLLGGDLRCRRLACLDAGTVRLLHCGLGLHCSLRLGVLRGGVGHWNLDESIRGLAVYVG